MRKSFIPLLPTMAVSALAMSAASATAVTAQDAEAGAAIFRGKGNCFVCHGPEAEGTPLAPDLTDREWVNFERRPTQAETEGLVKKGVPKPVRHPAPMPPMGGARLSDQEVADVAAYILSLTSQAGERPALDSIPWYRRYLGLYRGNGGSGCRSEGSPNGPV